MALPEEFSWRGVHDLLLPVVLQAGNTCYIEAALQTISAHYKIKNMKDDQEELSKQELINCLILCEVGCGGCVKCTDKIQRTGSINKAFAYVRDHGVCLAKDYPFDQQDSECNPPKGVKRYGITGYVEVDERDREKVKKLLLKHPLAGCIPIYRRFDKFSGKGVYVPEPSDRSNNPGKHAIVLIGYGIDEVTKKLYYDVKNSLGPEWAEGGVGRIVADLVTRISYPTGVHVKQREKPLPVIPSCLVAGTSAGPHTIRQPQVEAGVEEYERLEEESDEDKGKGVQGVIQVENPDLVKPKNLKARDVDMETTTGLSRESEEIEKQKAHERYMKLQEQEKTEQAREDLECLALVRQQVGDAAKKNEQEKAAKEQKKVETGK